jgi:toxin YoeB
MGKFRLKIEKAAQTDINKHIISGNKALINKIETILVELSKHPYTGIEQPEQLKYNLSGFWSRRINKKDRLVYKVEENIVTVFVFSAMGHYKDK